MPTTRSVGGYKFRFVGVIEPVSDRAGKIVEYVHDLPAGVRPNRYARGPFCRFQLQGAGTGSGVYTIAVDDELKYVGECDDLAARFGPNGYGAIAARNCHSDGQATNCKANSLVLSAAKSGEVIGV